MSNYVPTLSSDEVFIGTNTNVFLTPTLESIEADVSAMQTGKAASDHVHTEYAESDHTHTGFASEDHVHSGYAVAGHTHTDYAEVDHTHTGFASEDHVHSGYADANHTHTGFASSSHSHTAAEVGAAEVGHTHTGFAAENHSHSGYATANHSHTPASIGAAVESHSHTGYAASNHTHSGYAASSHTHSDYFPVSGGTINGDTNVAGVIRANGQQAFYYATGTKSQTIGTANATGGTTIACGADANTVINGANVKMKNSLPQASNTYTLGNTTVRWKGIYSNNAVNVASDRRLKRDIQSMDNAALAEFINKLNVVSYNYNDDDTDAQSRIGMIAQDVQAADAEIAKFFVSEGEDGMLGMTPADLVFALIATVQELKIEIDALKAK